MLDGDSFRPLQPCQRVASSMLNGDRKNAFRDAKSAVSAYAREPSDTNAVKVHSAWEAVKNLNATPIWRHRSGVWLQSNPGADDGRE